MAGLAADKDENPTIKIRLHPAPAPRPALKYQLLPPLLDRRPGNAAVQYLKGPHEHTGLYSDQKFWILLDQWREMPLPELRKEPDKDENKKFLTQPLGRAGNGMFEQLDTGARCESCDWDIPIREYDYVTMFWARFNRSERQPGFCPCGEVPNCRWQV